MMPYSRHLRATSNPIRAVTRLARTVVWTVLAVSISSGASAAPLTFTDSGALAADIQDTVDAFRTTLGALNANLLPPRLLQRQLAEGIGVLDARERL
ncbi:hypothetical protein [Luteitalea sp.]|uniref:hypothetical protein n=1 Tax=Luteitalea sp. TaxID=2004800 RepID=UPI0025C3CBBA|nr:hypothetical protein [Luteitalea sp.]